MAQTDLKFRIGADIAEIKAALASIQSEFGKLKQASKQVGGDALKGVESNANGALASVRGLIAGFVSFAAVLKTIGAADNLNTLNARLKIATSSVEEFARAQQALFELSQRTRTGLAETIDLYSKIASATKDAKLGQETLLEVVETINQAVQLSGASTQAAQAALIQLGQGLASGTLRGEELNSILEQTPALADAIAKGMGITRGELKKYGEEGKITAQQVINALQAQKGAVAEQFAQLPLTVGQSVTLVKNATLQLVGAFDSTSGATSGLANVIKRLADFLQSDDVLGAVIRFGSVWSSTFELIVDDVSRAVEIIRDATKNITGSGEDMIDILGRAFRDFPVNVRAAVKIATVALAAGVDQFIADAKLLKEAFAAIFTDDTIEAAIKRRNDRVSAAMQAAKDSINEALAERQQVLDKADKAADAAQRKRDEARKRSNRTGLGTFNTTQSDADKRKAEQERKAQLDAEEKLLDDSTKRQLATLGNLFTDSKIAAADYYARRTELELAGLDRSIAIERERAKAGGADKIKALAEIELLERRKTDIQEQAARDRVKFEREIERELEQARIAKLEAEGKTVEAARAKAEAQYRDLLAKLQAQGNTEGVALIESLIGSQVADAKLSELKDKIGQTISELRGTESLVSAQADAGLLPALEAERQLQTLRERSIEQLKDYRDALAAIAAAQTVSGGVADPRVLELLRQTDTEIARVTASQRAMQTQIEQSAQSSVAGFFSDLATGAKSFSDAVKAAALSFVQSLGKMAAEALAKRAMLALGGGGGGGGLFGMLASIFHSGGVVGQGGVSRMVNPLVFAGAPRYHSGGMVGLKPDERPAILQTGERVLSRDEVRNSGSGASGGTRIINVIDPSMVSDYMASSAGEKTVLNILQRNPGAVRQVLA